MELTLYSYSKAWRYYTKSQHTADLIRICLEAGINRPVLQIDASVMPKFAEEPANLLAGMTSMTAAGLKIMAAWNANNIGWDVAQDGYTLHQMIDNVLTFNARHPEAKWAGLEFDLEPVGGSTMEQHAAHLEKCILMLQELRAYKLVVDGVEQSIASQGMPIWMFCDPRWGRGVCADPWGRLCAVLDVIENEAYRFGGTINGVTYPEGIECSVAYTADAVAKVIAAGKKFINIISVTESSKYSDSDMADAHWSTRYNFGGPGCAAAIADYENYYSAKYPANFIGSGYYYDIDAFIHFHMLRKMTGPTSVVAGEPLSIAYEIYRKEEAPYLHKVFGVEAEVSFADGTVISNSELIDVPEGSVINQTIEVPIPLDAPPGPAQVRMSILGVEYISPYAAGTDPWWPMLYYRDFSGYTSQLLAMSVDELYAMAPADAPRGTLDGRRPEPILLQQTEWVSGLTIKEGTMAVLKTINVLLRVRGKVQVLTGDQVVETDPGVTASVPITLKSNAAADTPVSFSLSPAVAGVTLVTTSGVAKAKAETVIPVQIQVGDLAEGEYALQLTTQS